MKKLAAVGLIALSAFLSVPSAAAATVTGTVEFVSRRGQKPTPSETLVWLDAVAPMRARKPESAQMITKSKTIIPHVLAVPVGSTVAFPNEDPILHNLFSVSPSNAFDLGLYKKGSGKSEKFEAPGVVNVYCNVHPNMSAVVHVMSTPYYVFADSSGGYRLEDVAPGRYRLTAWNEQGGTATRQIEVTDSGVKGETSLTLDSRNFRQKQHLNKSGQPYSRSRSNEY
jgi:plastocyanin